jgi:antitoxin (DNA-binding transcriptional repressor) of toxin-antitoxin stability system
MENVSITHARDHLEELISRATDGENVEISVPQGGVVRLLYLPVVQPALAKPKRRQFGRLAGKIAVPEGLLDPMTEEDLRDWYGD